MSGQARCFNLYPGTKILSFVFVRMIYIQKRQYFEFLKINAIVFIVCAQNQLASENMRTLIASVNTCLTFLTRTTDVVNGIHCIKGEKVPISSRISLALPKYTKFTFCLFMYICSFGRSKKVEHLKEEKYASTGDEYSHNFTN